MKMATGVHCDGEEEKLSDCYHDESGATVTTCPRRDMVAGVVCATGSLTSVLCCLPFVVILIHCEGMVSSNFLKMRVVVNE